MGDSSKKYNVEDTEVGALHDAAISYLTLNSPLHVVRDLERGDKHGFLSVIKKGLEYKTLKDFMSLADFHIEEMATILHITSRTIRRLDTGSLLNIDISEKVLELLRLYKFGIEIFGDKDVFNVWVRRSIRGLGGVTPLSLLDTGIGVEIVMDELERIAYGVYN